MTPRKPIAADVLPLWSIYRNPSDSPCSYVARRWDISNGQVAPTGQVIVGYSLEAVRAQLPDRLVRMERAASDDATIVELWI